MLQKLIGMTGLNWFDFAVLLLIVAGALYWWARKSAKHPEYARRVEAKGDAALADLMRRAGVSEEYIAKVVAFDATQAGAEAYTRGQALMATKLSEAESAIAEARRIAESLRDGKN